jgi:hypothetical protein
MLTNLFLNYTTACYFETSKAAVTMWQTVSSLPIRNAEHKLSRERSVKLLPICPFSNKYRAKVSVGGLASTGSVNFIVTPFTLF